LDQFELSRANSVLDDRCQGMDGREGGVFVFSSNDRVLHVSLAIFTKNCEVQQFMGGRQIENNVLGWKMVRAAENDGRFDIRVLARGTMYASR
jgi:hypothetical protein